MISVYLSFFSSESLSMLPGYPSIFHGREKELQEVVDSLQGDAARVAILGPGGMGKTSLAAAVLYHSDVTNKYPNRYFVPCHSTFGCADIISAIAAHVGLQPGPNLAKKIYRHFTYAPPSLLVLDNFETPWESTTLRGEVEDYLALIADIPQLAILITMRGAERPGKIKWTRPFLPPLQPLATPAAWQTFVDIADENEEETQYITELLNLTDNMPLAVTLMASVAAYEGCLATLARWKRENTLLLSDGYDKRSSLDISIMLSFSSSRMTPDAQDLLSILSLLPDGLSDADLVQSNLPIPNILACKSIVLRTSLAYSDSRQRLRVLVPIREHIRTIHPPSEGLRKPLWLHFCQVVDLWHQFDMLPSSDIVSKIGINLGNIHALLADGLGMEGQELVLNLRSIMALNLYSIHANRGPSPLISHLPEKLASLKTNEIYGQYLIMLFSTAAQVKIPDENRYLSLGNLHFQQASDLEKVAECRRQLLFQPNTRHPKGTRMLRTGSLACQCQREGAEQRKSRGAAWNS
ncbi:P-loop containing nucleoside triphosphate hydrolase protein [Mycena galopus ATCC 62051]|nr:P-loop containing nucleoside triphosphate hydrolase protein [Mycena galopus ATCC 62051]